MFALFRRDPVPGPGFFLKYEYVQIACSSTQREHDGRWRLPGPTGSGATVPLRRFECLHLIFFLLDINREECGSRVCRKHTPCTYRRLEWWTGEMLHTGADMAGPPCGRTGRTRMLNNLGGHWTGHFRSKWNENEIETSNSDTHFGGYGALCSRRLGLKKID